MATKKKKSAKPKASARKKAPVRKQASSSPSPKAVFLEHFQREHATTARVLRALPPGQSEFRPHPRSQCARELAFTFVMEQNLISLTIRDQFKLGAGAPKTPTDFSMIVDQFEADYNALVELIKKSPDKAFEGTVDFPVGPGKIAPWQKLDFMWMMLHDQIHHRGQYAVYVRMAGGKVPSIYGPSGDEPWF
jgi:uncharacterized damage-inducible protein DinB